MTVKKIALLGQPNSGKSTIFNTLTGMHQHVGNWPGKTVEKKEGSFTRNGVSYELADLPGAYSLSANSEEEIVTRDYIAKNDVDLVCVLADGSQLERSLYMLADFAGIKTPAMLVITMIDVAKEQGKKINTDQLSKRLGIPVASVVAPDKKSYDPFFETLENALQNPRSLNDKAMYEFYKNGKEKENFLRAKMLAEKIENTQKGRRTADWLAGKLLEQDEAVLSELSKIIGTEETKQVVSEFSDGALYTSDCKFKWIETILDGVVLRTKEPSKLLNKFDRAAISPRWGKLIAIVILFAALMGSMVVASPIMFLGGTLPGVINSWLGPALASVGVSAGIVHFVEATFVTALGWVVAMIGFVFGINLIFGLIEEVGYMARVSYAFDGTMSRIGLQGKAIMPLLVGFGCTIGGAAGTRVMDSWGQRILTMAVVWAVPCGATFVVIPTLANAFFGWGGMLVMALIFVIMFLHIMITAKIFGRTLNPSAERTGLIMELPPYHKPRWGFIIKQALNRVWDIFKKAFSIELIVCVIFYFLSYSSTGIEGSILYKVGIFIEPVTRFFGMGWQTFLSFVAAMISKEAVLGVLSAIFANSGSIFDSTSGTAAAVGNVGELAAAVISKAEALAFIVAVTFNIPCLQAVVSTYQESHSLKWTARIGGYYIVTALILSCIVYHVAALFL